MVRIAIDLTPVLPGGENGGAKVVVLSLIRNFKKIGPEFSFILLTAKCSHDELSFLDDQNVKRVCVLGYEQEKWYPFAFRTQKFFSKIVLFLSKIVQSKSDTLSFWLQKFSRKLQPKTGLLTNLKIDLLFCPFTDPRYSETGIPVVSIIHDLQHRDYPEFFSVEERQQRDIFFNETVRVTDLFIFVSEYTRQVFLKYFEVKQDCTKVIHNAIKDRIRNFSKENILLSLAKLGIGRRQYMYYPANFWPHKNHRILFVAYRMLLQQHPNCNLDLVLSGALEKEEKELRFAAKQMGMSDRIHFLGYISDDDLAAVWESCKFLIFPSLYEGFGIPVIEAMSFGKPVLCSNVASLPEVAGQAALLFDPRKPKEIVQCIERILDSPSLAITLAEKGKKRAACFKEKDMARQYLDVFESLLERGKQYNNSLTGIFPDRWTEANFIITFENCEKQRILKLSICLPEFIPFKHVKRRMYNNSTSKYWSLSQGEELIIEIPLLSERGKINFSVYPTFKPSKYGISDDERDLGVMLNKCVITTGDDEKDLIEI